MRRRQTDYEYLLDTGVFRALSVRNCESLERAGVRIMAGQFVPFELVSGLDLDDEQDIKRRRAAIRKYQRLVRFAPGLLPQDLVRNAFGYRPARGALDLEKLCAEISNTVDSSVLRRRLTHNPVFIRTKEEATRVSSSFVETVLAEVERFTAGAKKELEDEGLAGSHVNYSVYVRRLEQSGDLHRL